MQDFDQSTKRRLQELSVKARILGLPHDTTLPKEVREIFRLADNEGRELYEIELQTIRNSSITEVASLLTLQRQSAQIVTTVKDRLLVEDPALVEHGGALYPAYRAEACWRDCWHFLRIAIYAVAAKRPQFTQPEGVQGLRELYQELSIPIISMALALSYLRETAVKFYSPVGDTQDVGRLDNAINHLETMVSEFSSQPLTINS
jgi:hypothetical protein